MEKYGFIYLWFDKKRKMYYIGCHWGTVDDGYICSSKWMRDAYRYRPKDFKRRIVQNNIKRNMLLNEEYRWLQMIKDDEMKVRYYNLSKKHFGHWSNNENTNKTVKQKLSEATKKLHQDPAYREKFLEGRKKLPPRTEEAIKKTADSNRGKKRTEETRRKISDSNKGKILGPLSQKTKEKLSITLSGKNNPFYGKQHDPELKLAMNKKTSNTLKGKRPKNLDMFVGSVWWNNGTINKRTKECPGSDWFKGRKKKV
jgi:hypothetical protein